MYLFSLLLLAALKDLRFFFKDLYKVKIITIYCWVSKIYRHNMNNKSSKRGGKETAILKCLLLKLGKYQK